MTAISIIIAIIIFGLLIFTHELGHFLAAKACKIGVIEFSIGMGPRLFSFGKGETKYSFKAIPFGGSCRMVGEDAAGGGEIDIDVFDEDEESQHFEPENSFNKKSVWARLLVVAAGPLFNFVFAFILGIILVACSGTNDPEVYAVASGYGAEKAGIQNGDLITELNGRSVSIGTDILLYQKAFPITGDVTVSFERDGKEHTVTYDSTYKVYRTGMNYLGNDEPAKVYDIQKGSPAYEAGIRNDDVIVNINGQDIASGISMSEYFKSNPMTSEDVSFTIKRGSAHYNIVVTPKLVEGNTLGFSATNKRNEATFVTAITGGFKEMCYGARAVFLSVRMLFTGVASVKDVSGPVGIVSVISNTVKESAPDGALYVFLNMLVLSILLSTNLGIVNMLPFPALDGGRFLLLLVEGIFKKKLPRSIENKINMVGFIFLMLLMIVILFSDIFKLFS